WQKRHALTPSALRGSENTLVRTGARAHQQHSFVRQPQALCKGQGRLVVPALSFALPVERHGHDYIGGELISVALYKLRQSLCKPNDQSSICSNFSRRIAWTSGPR